MLVLLLLDLFLKTNKRKHTKTILGGLSRAFSFFKAMTSTQKAEIQSFPLFSPMRGMKEMCQPAEHPRESAVLPLNQAKKLVSVIGTSKPRSHLAEQASCFQNAFTGLHAGATQYSNFHPLDRGVRDLEVGSSFVEPFFLSASFLQGSKTVVDILNCLTSLLLFLLA